jgi:transposase InsO family protein
MKPDRNQFIGDSEMTTLLKTFDHFQLTRGVLYGITKLNEEECHQLVLPSRCRSAAMRSLHDNVGHPGRDRTVSLLKERFYWPGLIKDVESYLQRCDRCLKRKSSTAVRAPLVSIETSQPLELVCMDFLTLEPSKGGQQYVLVITDHFTRYAQAYPYKNTTAKTTADLFFNNFVIHYGLPKRIHSDKGANFVGNLMTELCKLLNIDKSTTTPYHPMGNGMCERFNRTLCEMLGTLDPDSKSNWKAHVGPLVHAYDCIKHETTNHSSFFLMFGRHPRLPVNLAFGLGIEPSKPKSLLQYTKSIQERLKKAYDLAEEKTKLSQANQK